ncbi:MAG: polysaccharide deacetylase family protein [Bacteroidota bacterium]
MRYFHVPDFYAALNPWAIWHGNRNSRTLYITFDDGPYPEVTPQALQLMKENNAKATFFCNGRQAEEYPGLVQAIKDEGHTIGNHGYAHLNGRKTPVADYVSDVEKAQETLQSTLFRPPYGKITRHQRKRLSRDYRIMLWDVMPYDFDTALSKEKAWEKARKHIKPGSIIVLHDTPKARYKMLYLLEKILVYYKVAGMRFEEVNQL